jgi:catechol 2,3-dioxygenase-like lactoylglutathione lyase family enzyme
MPGRAARTHHAKHRYEHGRILCAWFFDTIETDALTMPRGLDHITHAVRDLDAAAELYRRLGFTVGARNRHPPAWGTENHVVQLAGSFIEVLGLGDASGMVPHGERTFSFGAHNRDFLSHQEGLSMIALEGRGTADAEAFRAAGIGDYKPYDFEREAKRPDGTPIKVAFSLAFAHNARSPEIGFFTCQHHHPENFWNPAFQEHTNTAHAVAGVVLVAKRPGELRPLLSAWVGQPDLAESAMAITATTPRGDVEVLSPAAFSSVLGVASPKMTRGPRIAALRLAVRDFGMAVNTLKRADVKAQMRMGRIVVPPEVAMGATLVFEPAG